MAIKVGGTTVIDDSRQLTNIASVDAATVAALGTAGVGGGGGTYDFVASGAISNGDLVGLKADGTVSVVQKFASDITTFEAASSIHISAVFDSNSNKVVIAYRAGSQGKAVVGTVSGTSISFGTPVVFASASANYVSATFDSNSNKVVIAYRDESNSNYGTAVVGTVSGTSISFGTPVVFESLALYYISATFDSNANKVVIAYSDSFVTGQGQAVVGTVSGTSISFGTPVVFRAGSGNFLVEFISAVFDSNSNKVVIAYRDNLNNAYGTAVVGTVSGTSISFGTPAVFYSATVTEGTFTTFDSNANKVVIIVGSRGVVGTVSGTSISFGTPVSYAASVGHISVTFDSNANKVVVVYADGSNGSIGTLVTGTVSGTSISFSEASVFGVSSQIINSVTFDSNSNRVVNAFRDGGSDDYGKSYVLSTTAIESFFGWVGISSEAISDTATGKVTVIGGVNEGLTGLTTSSAYYLQDDATIGTTAISGREIGRALSPTKLLVSASRII